MISEQWSLGVPEDPKKSGVEIKVDPSFISSVEGTMKPYKTFPRTLRPALEKVADYVRMEMIPRTFHQEGPGWRPLARRTQRERAALGYDARHPILYRSGDLYKELTEKGHPKHVEIIKTGKNSRILISGSSDKFMRNQGGNALLHIPARPMIPGTGGLPLPERDKKNITKILTDEIARTLRNG